MPFEPRVLPLQDPEQPAGSGSEVPPSPSILSAHTALTGDPSLGGLDGITIVFSESVDPATVAPAFFSVVRSNGTFVTPRRALLAPADESDEHRTVLLIGEFLHPAPALAAVPAEPLEPVTPSDVAVVGPLFSAAGHDLEGLAATVEAFATPGRMVYAEAFAASERACPGAAQVVRTYWIDPLRGVTIDDLASITVTLASGRSVMPTGFDDHDPAHEDTQDNVLDLCLSTSEAVASVRIAEAVFHDAAGHPSAAMDHSLVRSNDM